jgi:hypothetical protein
MADLASFCSSGRASAAGRPSSSIHSPRAHPLLWVEVFVFLLFDLLVGGPQHLGSVLRQVLDDLANELPVEMVLCHGQGDALDDLSLLSGTA